MSWKVLHRLKASEKLPPHTSPVLMFRKSDKREHWHFLLAFRQTLKLVDGWPGAGSGSAEPPPGPEGPQRPAGSRRMLPPSRALPINACSAQRVLGASPSTPNPTRGAYGASGELTGIAALKICSGKQSTVSAAKGPLCCGCPDDHQGTVAAVLLGPEGSQGTAITGPKTDEKVSQH